MIVIDPTAPKIAPAGLEPSAMIITYGTPELHQYEIGPSMPPLAFAHVEEQAGKHGLDKLALAAAHPSLVLGCCHCVRPSIVRPRALRCVRPPRLTRHLACAGRSDSAYNQSTD